MDFTFGEKKYCKKDLPQRNLAANIQKRTFGAIFEPPYLKVAIRSHEFFSRI